MIFIILTCGTTPINAFGDNTSLQTSCEILVDWDVQYNALSLTFLQKLFIDMLSILNQFMSMVLLLEEFIQAQHLRNGLDILSQEEITSVNAGGVIDIVLKSQPIFNDKIILSVETSETSCIRDYH